VYKGVPGARIEVEVTGFDDAEAVHCVQENAWTDSEVLNYWCGSILSPIFRRRAGTKVLLIDSLQVHRNNEETLKCDQDNVEIRYVPEHCTAILQPDIGVIKVFKQHFRRLLQEILKE